MGLLIHAGAAGHLTMEPLAATAERPGLWVQICRDGNPVSLLELSSEGFLLSFETVGAEHCLGVLDSVEFIPHEAEPQSAASAAPGAIYDPDAYETHLAVATLQRESSPAAKAFYAQLAAAAPSDGEA